MGMINKTVSGDAESYKLVKNGKNYPKTAKGGTQRTSYTGSSDNRAAGAPGPHSTLLNAPGLIDEGPVLMKTQNDKQPNNTTNGGPNTGVNKRISVANESVESGMGGTVYGPMKPFGASGSNGAFSNNVKK